MIYGDLATWVGSIGVVGTLYLALVQIRAEQRQRRADQHAALQRERRQQAERISGWPGNETAETTTLILLNRSDEPVYEVVASLVFVQGGGARRGEDYRAGNLRPLSVISVLPPGRWRVDVHGNWHGMNRRPGVEVAFLDRAGIAWIRRAAGALEEVNQSPIDHYGLGRPQGMGMPESDEVLPVHPAFRAWPLACAAFRPVWPRADCSRGSWPTASLPARTVGREDRWSTSGPQTSNFGRCWLPSLRS